MILNTGVDTRFCKGSSGCGKSTGCLFYIALLYARETCFFSCWFIYPFNMKIVVDHIHERQTRLPCIHFFRSQVDHNYIRFVSM